MRRRKNAGGVLDWERIVGGRGALVYELQSGLIDARLAAEFERQEAEDAYRLGEGLEAAVNDEFENGGRVMQKIREFYERRMGHGVSGKGDDSVKNRDVAAWIAAHGKRRKTSFPSPSAKSWCGFRQNLAFASTRRARCRIFMATIFMK